MGFKEIPKYLFGYNLHQYYKSERNNIKENTENLTSKVIKLGLNYSLEGSRQVVRYSELAFDVAIIYGVTKGYLPLFPDFSFYVGVSAATRWGEQFIVYGFRAGKWLKKYEQEAIKFNENIEALDERINGWNDKLDELLEMFLNNPSYQRLWKKELLENPYEALGLDETANETDIKKAYRSIAFECRPDLNFNGNEKNKEKFFEATNAYNQLTGRLNKL